MVSPPAGSSGAANYVFASPAAEFAASLLGVSVGLLGSAYRKVKTVR